MNPFILLLATNMKEQYDGPRMVVVWNRPKMLYPVYAVDISQLHGVLSMSGLTIEVDGCTEY